MEGLNLAPGDQARIARESGYSQQMISCLCTGERRPHWRSARFKKLCAVTGTDPEIWQEGTPAEIKEAIKKGRKKHDDISQE